MSTRHWDITSGIANPDIVPQIEWRNRKPGTRPGFCGATVKGAFKRRTFYALQQLAYSLLQYSSGFGCAAARLA